MRLHHVQVSCPPGGEAESRRFYAVGLGLTEVAKPAVLAARGGCWFRAEDDSGQVTAEIHVGVEDPFVAAQRAHLALVVDATRLDELAARLWSQGHPVDERERTTFPGHLRFHTADPHGNRVEILSPA